MLKISDNLEGEDQLSIRNQLSSENHHWHRDERGSVNQIGN